MKKPSIKTISIFSKYISLSGMLFSFVAMYYAIDTTQFFIGLGLAIGNGIFFQFHSNVIKQQKEIELKREQQRSKNERSKRV